MTQTSNAEQQVTTTQSIDLRLLPREIARVAHAGHSAEQTMLQMVELIVRLTNAAAAVYFITDEDESLAAGARYLSKQALTWSDALLAELASHAKTVVLEGVVSTSSLSRKSDTTIITVPVLRDARPAAALTVLLVTNEQSIESFVAAISLCGSILSLLPGREKSADSGAAWQHAIELIGAFTDTQNTTDRDARVLDAIKRHSACSYAIVSLHGYRGITDGLRFPASLADIDRRSELSRAIAASMDEAHAAGEVLRYDARRDVGGSDAVMLRSVAGGLSAEAIVTATLHKDERPAQNIGLMLIWEKASAVDHDYTARINDLLGVLHALFINHTGRAGSFKLPWAKTTRPWAVLGSTLLALAIILMVPVTHEITANASLEPVERRYIVAPFDATLAGAFYKPGDVITAGSMLAKLDGKELRLDIDGIEAELDKVRNRRRVAVASGKTSEAQLARFEIEKLESKRALLESRYARIEIHSSIDGILLAGDLARNSGSPLRTGQTLFEVAPLSELVARVAIPDHSIAHSKVGMPLTLRYEALPNVETNGRLERIHPRATIVEGANVFVGEALISNTDGRLRPGMTARAKLAGGQRSIGWVLFHRAWARLRLWLW